MVPTTAGNLPRSLSLSRSEAEDPRFTKQANLTVSGPVIPKTCPWHRQQSNARCCWSSISAGGIILERQSPKQPRLFFYAPNQFSVFFCLKQGPLSLEAGMLEVTCPPEDQWPTGRLGGAATHDEHFFTPTFALLSGVDVVDRSGR